MKNNTLQAENRNLDYNTVGKKLIKQLSDYADNAKSEGYVMGVSGGVDSGLVSTLCAMSGKVLKILSMPIHQNTNEVDRANEQIEWLQNKYANVTSKIIDLSQVYDIYKSTLDDGNDEFKNKISDANLRSRLRASTLYDIAGRNNLLVAGTGNLIEDYGIGFFTKFGDGAVDISPIGELYKSEVRELAAKLGVPSSVVQAIATDGLHTDGATDEDQIGANYNELEWALEQYDLGKRTYDFEGRAKKIIEIYSKRHENNTHKMNMPPVFKI